MNKLSAFINNLHKSIPITSFAIFIETISTQVHAKRIFVTDLGPNPIITLFIIAIVGAVIWIIGANQLDDCNEMIGEGLVWLGSKACIGGIISIFLNLLLMGHWWVIILMVICGLLLGIIDR